LEHALFGQPLRQVRHPVGPAFLTALHGAGGRLRVEHGHGEEHAVNIPIECEELAAGEDALAQCLARVRMGDGGAHALETAALQ
jgi:hypothetical protein